MREQSCAVRDFAIFRENAMKLLHATLVNYFFGARSSEKIKANCRNSDAKMKHDHMAQFAGIYYFINANSACDHVSALSSMDWQKSTSCLRQNMIACGHVGHVSKKLFPHFLEFYRGSGITVRTDRASTVI